LCGTGGKAGDDVTIYGRQQQTLMDYGGFLKKFKPKKTTDDCITPDAVYDAILGWVIAEYELDGREIVRPFWPGGDYEMFDYPEECVVIDNPPFSILTPITRFYVSHGIDFFLFAPHLSAFSSAECTNHIQCGCQITYDNGAVVPTSFKTSLGCWKIDNAPSLYEAVEAAKAKEKATAKKPLHIYAWPDELLRTSELDPLTSAGIRFTVAPDECVRVSNLDAVRDIGKSIFGGAYLISTAKAEAKAEAKIEAKAEARAKVKIEAVKIELSPAERLIVEGLVM
jgi:hypothetical protein